MQNEHRGDHDIDVADDPVMKIDYKGLLLKLLLVVIILPLGISSAAFAYIAINAPVEKNTDYRNCATRLSNDVRVEAVRSFNYRERNILGFKFIENESTVVETRFKLDGTPLTVMGKGKDGYWIEQAGEGELGITKAMPAADEYVIIKGNAFTALSFEDFCRPISTQTDLSVAVKNAKPKL